MPHSLTIPSGLEPIDRFLGGLKGGQLYLAHGAATGRSHFAARFLIEGLKRGEQSALVIGYSSENAVNLFAQAGYDCTEDVYGSRLVILEYSDEIFRQGMRPRQFASVLREMEWLLGEARPQRLVFDTITQIVTSEEGSLQQRVGEFAEWVRSFGATVLLVADETHREVIQHFRPLVDNSFRFDHTGDRKRAIQRLIFEKSPEISDQELTVVPARGEEPQAQGRPATTDKESVTDMRLTLEEIAGEQVADELEKTLFGYTSGARPPATDEAATQESRAEELAEPSPEIAGPPPEFISQDSPLDLDDVLPEARKLAEQGSAASAEDQQVVPSQVAESLLHPPGDMRDTATGEHVTAPAKPHGVSGPQADARPKDCRVLIIDHDTSSRGRVAQTLDEYAVAVADEGVSGLAGIISFNPDLVILSAELPGINGFKVLAHIRANFAVPIILVSSSHARASDRVLAAELGADYYVTQPFNIKELRQKSRQLIARHRGITSWIIAPPSELSYETGGEAHQGIEAVGHRMPAELSLYAVSRQIKPYPEFAALVEESVREALEHGTFFTVIGCRLPQVTPDESQTQIKFMELLRSLVRDTDALSTNPQQDLLVLLTDADPDGARACISRLSQRVEEEFHQEPTFWMRSFPKSEEDSNGHAGGENHLKHGLTRSAQGNGQQ